MAQASQLMFILGTIATAIALGLHVGHAVLLANGRRIAAAFAASPTFQPSLAAAGVTGSFVTSRASRDARGPSLSASSTGLTRAATLTAAVAFALLLGSLVVRAVVVGRGPYGNLYEFSEAFGTTIMGGYLFLAQRYAIRQIGFIPMGVALAVLLYASSLPGDVSPLVPALQNAPLLTIHVGMAVLSYGIFATAFAAGVGYLVQGTRDRFAWLPSHRTLDAVAYRAVIIAFPIFATMIVLGSWWASIAWSAYWSWDPKETSALVTWLTYAVYLHARNQRRWAGRPAALLLVVGFGMVLVTYSGSLWFTGLHSYSGL
jgi:cytochrome c-type biogenesis protein CcsB